MSLSTLPDIFKRSQTIQVRATKQGPSFSLHLNSLSPQKHLTSRAGYAPDENKQVLFSSGKARSMSTQQVKSKESVLHEISAKRNGNSSGRMRVSFKEDLELSNSMPLKQKIGMSVMNMTNFPYENNRRINNNTAELQETDNLSKKLQALTKETQNLQKTLSAVKQQNNQCKSTYLHFCKHLSQELEYFSQTFEQSLKQCYKHLSTLRRQTNQQIKSSRIQLQKIKGDMNTCSSFTNDLKKKTSDMYSDYVKTAQIQELQFKDEQLMFDFQQISSIRKSSRGATGDISRRTKRNDMPLTSNRKSDDLKLISGRENKFVLNGKQIDLLNFQEEC